MQPATHCLKHAFTATALGAASIAPVAQAADCGLKSPSINARHY